MDDVPALGEGEHVSLLTADDQLIPDSLQFHVFLDAVFRLKLGDNIHDELLVDFATHVQTAVYGVQLALNFAAGFPQRHQKLGLLRDHHSNVFGLFRAKLVERRDQEVIFTVFLRNGNPRYLGKYLVGAQVVDQMVGAQALGQRLLHQQAPYSRTLNSSGT